MDRPLRKKFNPRPKIIHRTDGSSHWVANPCVSEHFLSKHIGDLDKQSSQYYADQSRQQRELQKELRSIHAVKNYRPGPSIFRRRGSRKSSLTDNSIADMIDKFNKKRVEQSFVNNLTKKRRDSMNSMSAGNHRKSVASMWDDISAVKSDILNIDAEREFGEDFESLEDEFSDENISNSLQSPKNKSLLKRRNNSRKSVYEVSKEKNAEFGDYESCEKTSYSPITLARRRPSYDSYRQDRNEKRNNFSNDSITNDRTRRAINLWGLVREKALGPDDLKTLRERSVVHDNNTKNLSKRTETRIKTDDEKLQEQALRKAGHIHHIEDERDNKITSPKTNQGECSDESSHKKDQENTGKPITDKNTTLKKNHDVHRKNTNKNKLLSPKANCTRPKSAKGRVRKQNHPDNKISETENITDKTHKHITPAEMSLKNANAPVTSVESDDDASLNNYLHSEFSGNDTSTENPERKLSCFTLKIDDTCSDKHRPSERMSHVLDSNDEKSRENSPRSRIDSVSSRHSTSSRKSSHGASKKSPRQSRKEAEDKNDELWDDVRRCRYLRGYDPPEMVMPSNVNVFVFGKDENDIIEENRQERLKQQEVMQNETVVESSETESF